MADVTQAISALRATSSGPLQQIWKEVSTGYYARLTGSLLVGISSGGSTDLILLRASSSGALYTEAQPSTEVLGHVILDASTAAIGQVGGHTSYVQVNLAPTTSAGYASGDLMGSAAFSLANVFRSTAVMTGVLDSIVIADKTTNQASFDFVLFATVTTGTTYTNDSPLTLGDGDLGKVVGFAQVLNSDYTAFVNNGVAAARNIGLTVWATTAANLTGAAILRTTTPVYATTGDLIATFGFQVD